MTHARYTPQPMTRFLICGYYGFGNTGDEAILHVLLKGLRNRSEAAEIIVAAGDPDAVRAEHGVEALQWQDIPGLIEAARSADLMVLGGGGLFQDYWGCHPEHILTPHHGSITYWAGFALLARITGTPLGIHGVGVGPLESEAARRYTRLAFEQAGTAGVRDRASLDLLAEIGLDPAAVTLAADPVWLLDPASQDAVADILEAESIPTAGALRIAVAIRPWGDDEKTLGELAAALDRFAEEEDADVLFVPFHRSRLTHENDAHAASRVAARMQHIDRTAILRGEYTPQETLAVIGSADLVIGMRLHSLIFAALAEAPAVAISYDPKVRRVMEELGLTDRVLELTAGSQAIVETARLARKRHNPAALGAAVEDMRARARLGEQSLHDLIAKPIVPEPTPDTVAVLGELTISFSGAYAAAASELQTAKAERDELRQTKQGLTADYKQLISTKAMRAMAHYWDLRQRLRTATSRDKDAPRSEGPHIDPQELAGMRDRFGAQLTEILELHADAPGFVVYPPSIGWDVTLFQRPQQMALAFAHLGYVVFYNLAWPNGEQLTGFRGEEPGIYLAALPDQLLDLYRAVRSPLAVSYVYNFAWHQHLSSPVTVYEHIDDLEVFTHTYQRDDLQSWHQEALRSADVVVASAVDLQQELADLRPDTVLVPNGVNYRHFARPFEPPEDLAALAGRPIVGYYGALAEWVDYDLIDHAARQLPEYEFVFIGPDYDGTMQNAPAFQRPNVTWLGPRPYGELPAYLQRFSVATIPFHVNEVTHAVSPLKLFEYMAGGRPVVTPALRECARYPAVLIASDPDDYVAQLRAAVALGDDPQYVSLLRRTARANTWEERAGTLIDAVARARR